MIAALGTLTVIFIALIGIMTLYLIGGGIISAIIGAFTP